MNEAVINKLKNKIINKSISNNKRVVDLSKFDVENGSYGAVCNQLLYSLKYEVFLYFNYNNEVASPIKLVHFDNKGDALKYYNELYRLISKNDINVVVNEILSA